MSTAGKKPPTPAIGFLACSALLILAVASLGCATPGGSTAAEKRGDIRRIHDQSLAELYKKAPELKARIASAPGYAVFSNIETKILLVGTGNGFGVVVDNETNKKTFMRMAKLAGGWGIGIKQFRGVFVFKRKEALRRFVDIGFQIGGTADVALKGEGMGDSIGFGIQIDPDIDLYQLTDAGAAVTAMVGGTRYWKDDELNY